MNRLVLFLLLLASCKDEICKDPVYLPHYEELLKQETFRLRQELFRYNNPDFKHIFKAVDSIDKTTAIWLETLLHRWDTNKYLNFRIDSLYHSRYYRDKFPSFSVSDSARRHFALCERHLVRLGITRFKYDSYKRLLSEIRSGLVIHYWSGPQSDFFCIPIVINGDTFLQISQALAPAKIELYEDHGGKNIKLPSDLIHHHYGFYHIDPKKLRSGKYFLSIQKEGPKGLEATNARFSLPIEKVY